MSANSIFHLAVLPAFQPAKHTWRHAQRGMRMLLPLIIAFAAIHPTHAAQAFDLPGIGKSVVPSGQIKTERREVSGFTGIALGIHGNVEIKQGTTEGVTIETDDNLIPLIRTTVEKGVLQIHWENRGTRIKSDNSSHKINITVHAINLNRLALGGSGTLRAAQLQTGDLSVSVGGSGNVRLDGLTAKKLVADIGGSGSIYAKGSVVSLTGAVGGSGGIRAEGLEAQDASLSMAGSGRATIWARDTLSIAIAGSGDVEYYGDPKVSTSKAGSGSVRRLGGRPGR